MNQVRLTRGAGLSGMIFLGELVGFANYVQIVIRPVGLEPLQRRDDRIAVSVRDSGIGISGVDQARIFERFYKANRARSSAEGGSGLGLAIAKRVVDMHRGAISVQSNTGQGAEFTVELPV